MYNIFLRNVVVLCTAVAFLFSQDVVLSLDGGSLNYESTSDIHGFQFNHDGCVSGASGGDAELSGFTLAASGSVVLGFSFSGSFISAGNGTLVELSGDIALDCLSAPVFSGSEGLVLDVVFSAGEPPADYVVEV